MKDPFFVLITHLHDNSLQAVAPSMGLLEQVCYELQAPVWINADILPGPGGKATPLEPRAFLDAVGAGACNAVLSLGWTTGWSPNTDNPGEWGLC